jgi:hypothetical protein
MSEVIIVPNRSISSSLSLRPAVMSKLLDSLRMVMFWIRLSSGTATVVSSTVNSLAIREGRFET